VRARKAENGSEWRFIDSPIVVNYHPARHLDSHD
jgi:hypothetical protein